MNIEKGFKEVLSVDTLVDVFVAFLAYYISYLLQNYVLSKITFLQTVPEVSDAVVMVAGAAVLQGSKQEAAVIGAGISLLNHLGSRFGIGWLNVGNK
jgi:hypothetical protein